MPYFLTSLSNTFGISRCAFHGCETILKETTYTYNVYYCRYCKRYTERPCYFTNINIHHTSQAARHV